MTGHQSKNQALKSLIENGFQNVSRKSKQKRSLMATVLRLWPTLSNTLTLATRIIYVYKLNDRRGNPEKPSFVFKTSELKAKFALRMDRTADNLLCLEFCLFVCLFLFYGKVKRCKGLVSLTASVYHPLLRRLITLATMECETEDYC